MTETPVRAEPTAGAPGAVTLVEGSTFCISGRSGDIDASGPQGLFFHDTRLVSSWQLTIGGQQGQVLAVASGEPFAATFVSRLAPPGPQTELLLERRRWVGDGMREDLRLRNLTPEPVRTTISLSVRNDFADVFAVKENRVSTSPQIEESAEGETLMLARPDARELRAVRVTLEGATARPGGLDAEVTVPARGEWRGSILVVPVLAGAPVAPTFPLHQPLDESPPARRLSAWRSESATVTVGHRGLVSVLRRSLEDLGSLRIFDPAEPAVAAVAAGAPWFMALFGRDSLLSSYMALPLDPSLALGTLQTLARNQGSRVDPRTEEEPGRILHETRLGNDFPLAHGGGSTYYGSADATPLFVMLLAEMRRWGVTSPAADALLPHADRALAWIEEYGDRDGDGFVEYARPGPWGLVNQGWKDSFDGVNFADGTLAEPPIALCEVQAYVYAAFVARSHLADEAGDAPLAASWADKARRLKQHFNEAFWLPDRGWFAIGLDRDKRPIDALASNMAHCLWTGIVDPDKAGSVAAHLVSPVMFTGWGIRTLASSMGAYNPMSYHNGSVWPHDNAIAAAGLMRYGYVEEAQRVATAVLDAALALGGRLPELFSGFDRDDYVAPLPYPTACSPQAWAAATPVQMVRTLLRVDPWMARGQVWFAPAWPERYGPLRVEHLLLAGRRVTLTADGDSGEILGLPDDVRVIKEARAPLTTVGAR